MLSIVWNNKWLYWQLIVACVFFFVVKISYCGLLKTALSHAKIRLISYFVIKVSWLCVCVCVCVCAACIRMWSEMTGGFAALLVLNVRWSQWMSSTPQCVHLSELKERESSHQIMLQPHSVTVTHIHTHIPTSLYSRTCSLAKPTSLNPACTSPSVSVLGGLGCRLLCYWMEQSGKCPTIGCCQLVKFFCYHGCRVSCPNVSQCI